MVVKLGKTTVFEAVAMGIGGNNYYKNCYVDLKESCLRSETTVKVFDKWENFKAILMKVAQEETGTLLLVW